MKNIFKLWILGLLLVSFNSRPSHSQRSIDPVTQLILENFIDSYFFPTAKSAGTAIAMVKDNGQVLYTTGRGFANAEKEIPSTNSTQYTIGSVSKGFTGILAIKVLSERYPHLGEKVMETPIRKLLPEANLTLITRYRSEHMTFRDLFSHRLCVGDDNTHILSGQISSREELLYRARYNEKTPNCDIRTQITYNNQMVAVAGYLIGLVENSTYEDAMEDLWDELGMNDTTFVKDTDDPEELSQRALPHYSKDEEYHLMNYSLIRRVTVANPSGGVTTTADDITKFMRLIVNDGEFNGKQIIKKEAMEWLRTPKGFGPMSYKKTDEDVSSIDLGYTFGFALLVVDGWRWIIHGGIATPYYAMMTTLPEMKLGIFSVTNTGPILQVDHFGLHAFVVELMKGNVGGAKKKASSISRILKEREVERIRGNNWRDGLGAKVKGQRGVVPENVTGKYGSGSLGEIEIVDIFNQKTNQREYFIEYGIWFRGWLEQRNEEGYFRIIWETDIVHDLYAIGKTEEDDENSWVFFTDEDTLYFSGPLAGGKFQRGVCLDSLPQIPWEPDSCR